MTPLMTQREQQGAIWALSAALCVCVVYLAAHIGTVKRVLAAHEHEHQHPVEHVHEVECRALRGRSGMHPVVCVFLYTEGEHVDTP